MCSVHCLKAYYKTNNIDIAAEYDSDQEEKESYELFKVEKKQNKEQIDNKNMNYKNDYDPMEDF